MNKTAPIPKQENIFLSLLFNIAVPIFILSKLSQKLGPEKALFLALCFPLCYAIFDFYHRRQINIFSILGFSSTLIKGTFAFFMLDAFWFAVQEAAIPLFLGVFTILSIYFKKPLVKYFIYNESVFNVSLLNEKLQEQNTLGQFEKLLKQFTVIFGAVFLVGACLNYYLATQIIVGTAGSEEFNKQLAQMTLWGHAAVAVPKMALSMGGLWWFIHNLKKLTGLNVTDMLRQK